MIIDLYYTKNDYTTEISELGIQYSSIINYNFIITKLTKNDIYKLIPSSTVTSFYLLREIKSVFEKNSERVLYIIKNLNHETIFNITETFNKLSIEHDIDIIINLIIKEDDIDSSIYTNLVSQILN